MDTRIPTRLADLPLRPTERAATTVAALAARNTPPPALSTPEQQAIDQFFPPAPQLAFKLYGPQGQSQTLQQSVVGGTLDLKG